MIKRYFRVLAVMIFFMILFEEGYKTWEYGVKGSIIGFNEINISVQEYMETEMSQSEAITENREELIAEDKYFKKMYLGNFIYSYAIYNAAGEIVEEWEGKEARIDYIDDSTIRRQIGAGTNALCTVYYDIVNDRLSETYMNPIAEGYGRVAYLDHKGEEIVLIVKNIFDNEFYKEISLDFADMFFPVKEAEFWDEETLYIKYHSGESRVEKDRTLKIEKEMQEEIEEDVYWEWDAAGIEDLKEDLTDISKDIKYPHLREPFVYNDDDEKRLNQIYKINKLLEEDVIEKFEGNFNSCELDYEITYFDKDYISVLYKGWYYHSSAMHPYDMLWAGQTHE